MEKEAKNKAVKAPLEDSDGVQVVSMNIKDETEKEVKSINKAAQKDPEVAAVADADAKARAEADAENERRWQEFLASR